jgi:hypothetical protein
VNIAVVPTDIIAARGEAKRIGVRTLSAMMSIGSGNRPIAIETALAAIVGAGKMSKMACLRNNDGDSNSN